MRALVRPAALLAVLVCLPGCGSSQADPRRAATTVALHVTRPTASGSAAVAPAPTNASGATGLAPAAQPTPAPEPAPLFVVRYACDDKYAAEAECRPGQAAWSAWLAQLALGADVASLLEHRGGGPSGAEWNPAAPLVAFVASSEPGRTQLRLSAQRTLEPGARWGSYDVFFVPFATWNGASRPARAADLAAPAQLDAIRVVELHAWGKTGELARGTFAFSGGE